jgi:hypothetical protein
MDITKSKVGNLTTITVTVSHDCRPQLQQLLVNDLLEISYYHSVVGGSATVINHHDWDESRGLRLTTVANQNDSCIDGFLEEFQEYELMTTPELDALVEKFITNKPYQRRDDWVADCHHLGGGSFVYSKNWYKLV